MKLIIGRTHLDEEEESFFSKMLEYFTPFSHNEEKLTEGNEYHINQVPFISGREGDFRRQPDTMPRSQFNQSTGIQRVSELRSKPQENVDRQPQVEVEPSEDAYDVSQAKFSNKIDNTSLDSQEVQPQPEHRSYQSQQLPTRSVEFNPSDDQYDDNQRSSLLDDNSRRQSWSANKSQVSEVAKYDIHVKSIINKLF